MNYVKVIWGMRAFAYKARFKRFGNMSYIGKPISLEGTKRVEIGNKVRIYPGSRIETHGDEAKIIIEDEVSIAQNFHVASVGSPLVIGKNTTISANVLITNSDHEYGQIGVHILKQGYSTKKTVIGEGCFIGYGSVLQAGTVLGKQCIVGANSVVRGEFPDHSVIVGAPARAVKRYSSDSGEWEKTKDRAIH